MGRAADVANNTILHPELAHLPGQVSFAFHGLMGCELIVESVVVVAIGGYFLLEDGLGNGVKTVASPDPPHDLGDVVLSSIQDGLDKDLQG